MLKFSEQLTNEGCKSVNTEIKRAVLKYLNPYPIYLTMFSVIN